MRVPPARRRVIARVALGTARVTAIWTGVLFFHGGFDTSVFGARIRTNDPSRPFLISFAAILVFVGSVGEDRTDAAMSLVLDSPQRLFARLDHRLLALVLALAISIVGLRLGSKAVGGSDSYGYVSQAELWLGRHLSI